MNSLPNPHQNPAFPNDPEPVRLAFLAFDHANAEDPNRTRVGDTDHPTEWLYARRLTDWVLRLEPNASIPLRLAARCQHLRRWMIPRASYPLTKAGYHQWRNDLKQFHADQAAALLADNGVDPDTIQCVRHLNLKRNFPKDADSRVLEDALCLVFLEFQLAELAAKTHEDKILNALRKSWAKMRPQARDLALNLPIADRERALIRKALDPTA